MLSHLAGATNRADIRRLRALEGERREMSEKLEAMQLRSSEREDEHRRLAREQAALVREVEESAAGCGGGGGPHRGDGATRARIRAGPGNFVGYAPAAPLWNRSWRM